MMNADVKILNSVFTNQIKRKINMVIHHNLVGFFLEMQGWFHICKLVSIINYIHGLKDRNHMVILTDAERLFDKTHHVKFLKELRIEEICLNIIRVICDNNKGYIMTNL